MVCFLIIRLDNAVGVTFLEMHDIACQLILKWARKGSEYKIPVADDFSRLTLDTIALCAMDFRFNSFYQDEMHRYVQAMNNFLGSRGNTAQISSLLLSFLPSTAEKLKQDTKYMNEVCQELVDYRRQHPTKKKDLLNAMIYGKDPKTGQTMRDGLIAANMQTFLIAGQQNSASRGLSF
jgi:cytochrome P450 / NADPH-cytochrome P450 reductase